MENQFGFGYTMPDGNTLYIISSRSLTEDEESLPHDEQIEGLTYSIIWGNKKFYFILKTRLQAFASAMGIQWGVNNV